MTKKVEKRVPDIRFKGFTDDWEQRKLGEVLSKFDYGLNTASTNYDGQNKYLRITDIDDNSHLFLKDNLTSPSNLPINKKNYQLKKGDMVFARTGASVGKTYKYLSEDGKVYFAGFLIRGRVKGKNDIGFVFNTTLQDSYKNFVKVMSIRSGQPGINSKEYQKHKIYVPKFNEQRELSNFISKLDKAIALQQKKLEQLKQFKKAMLQQIFPDKDGKLNIRFNGFNDAWEQRKLGEVVDVMSGQDYKHLDKGNIPVYGTGGYMLSVNKALSETEDAIGIGRKGTIDKPYLLKAPFWTVDTLFYSVPKKYYDLYFVNYIFQRIQWRKYDESTGVPSLSKKTINSVSVSIPKYNEQKQIGSYLSKFDSLIALHQRRGDHLKLLKKFLLQKMFI